MSGLNAANCCIFDKWSAGWKCWSGWGYYNIVFHWVSDLDFVKETTANWATLLEKAQPSSTDFSYAVGDWAVCVEFVCSSLWLAVIDIFFPSPLPCGNLVGLYGTVLCDNSEPGSMSVVSYCTLPSAFPLPTWYFICYRISHFWNC